MTLNFTENSDLLFNAVKGGDVSQVRDFLNRGANINAQRDDLTPLHFAAKGGNLNIAKLLIEKGADVNAQGDIFGLTPLHCATLYSHLEVAKLLIERGADINAKGDIFGLTPLHLAAKGGDLNVAKLLIERGADINAQEGRFGWTPLHFAADNYNLNVTELLIKKGANVSVKDNDSKTPIDFIVNWGKGSTESPALLTSGGHDNITVTDVPEINATLVNNTIILGILAAGQYRQPIHENLLSPREQSMRLNNIDEDMIMEAIQQGKEKFGDPNTDMDEVEISGNKTGMWKGSK